MVLCENEELVEDFMKHSEYKVQKSAHNAFDAVEVEAVAGEEMADQDLESLQFYLEDLEMQEEEGVEEEQEQMHQADLNVFFCWRPEYTCN